MNYLSLSCGPDREAATARKSLYRSNRAWAPARSRTGAGWLEVKPTTLMPAARADIADKELRGDYADFIRYAVGAGQVPGLGNGELPPGYAPIPADWTAQALAAATKIAAGPQPAATTTGSTTSTSGSSGFTGDLSTLDVPAADEQPAAAGDAAGDLSGPRTPADPVEVAATSAVPLSLVVTLAAAAATWLFGRRRRLRT